MNKQEQKWKETSNIIQLLGDALHSVLIADGVLLEDSNPTYPELLLASDEYVKVKLDATS